MNGLRHVDERRSSSSLIIPRQHHCLCTIPKCPGMLIALPFLPLRNYISASLSPHIVFALNVFVVSFALPLQVNIFHPHLSYMPRSRRCLVQRQRRQMLSTLFEVSIGNVCIDWHACLTVSIPDYVVPMSRRHSSCLTCVFDDCWIHSQRCRSISGYMPGS